MSSSLRRKLIAVCAICLALCLAGCRPSPKLEQIIYTDDATEVDIDHLKDQQDDDSDNEDEDFNDLMEQDADSVLEDQTQAAGINDGEGGSGGDGGEEGSGHRLVYDEDADDNGQAEGDLEPLEDDEDDSENADDDSEFEEIGETEPDTGGEETPDDNDDDEGPERESEEAESNVPDTGNNDDDSPVRTVDTGAGDEQQIIDNAHYYIATGTAAQLVEMLGGSGWLYASNSDFLENSLAQALCSDIAGGQVKSWWSGDGNSTLSDEYFQQLLQLDDYVVIVESGQNTFSASQLSQIGDKHYISIPRIDSAADLAYAAQIVAAAINTSAASAKAGSYVNMINNLSVSAGVSYYTCYLTGYHEDITYTFTSGKYDLLSGADSETGYSLLNNMRGVATAYSTRARAVVTDFLGKANIVNTSSEYYVDTDEYYVTPMFHQFSPKFSNDWSYSWTDGGLPQSYDAGIVHAYSGAYTLPGTEYYRAFIAADSATKNAIESDWYWMWHGDLSTNGQRTNAGWIANDGNTILNSSISGNYVVYVNPYGIGNWAEGSVDSPLETYWAAYQIYGGVSYSSLISNIQSFYKTYFDVSLSEGQINSMILAGR